MTLSCTLMLCLGMSAWADVGDSYVVKGNEYYRQGRMEEAIEQYRQAIKLNPDHLGAWQNLGLAYQSKKDFAGAIDTFREILRQDSTFVPAMISLGLVYAQKGRYQDAQDQYRRSVALEPFNLVGHLNLAAVLAHQRKFSEALKAAKRGLEIAPSSPELHLLMANVFYLQERYPLAKREYQKALKLQPQTLPARMMLAMCLAKLGDFDRALAEMHLVQNLDEQFPDVPLYLARIYALRFRVQGTNWKEAVSQYKLAAEKSPDNTEICAELAQILRAKRQYTEAKRWYRRVLENPKASLEQRRAVEEALRNWSQESKGKSA